MNPGATPPGTAAPGGAQALARASLDELARRCFGGAAGAIVHLAGIVTLGLVAFAPLGAAAPTFGIPAAFLTLALASLAATFAGRRIVPAFAPSFATALTLAALVAVLAADPASFGADGAVLASRVLPATGAAVVLCGLLQIVFALLGLGQVARYTPAPVLAGLMTGVGVLLMLAQLPGVLGLTPEAWRSAGLAAVSAVSLGPLVLGAGTMAFIWLLQPRHPRLPMPLLAMALGFMVFHAAAQGLPGLSLGRVLGPLPPAEGLLQTARALGDPSLPLYLASHAGSIAATALLLALLGSLEGMLALRSVDQQLGEQHDPRRELVALGLANVCGGLLCALPGIVLRALATSVAAAGGRGRAAGVGAAAVYGGLYLFARELLQAMPAAVLGGIMLVVGLMLIDRPSLRLLKRLGRGGVPREARVSLLIVVLVSAVTVLQGVATGVVLGVLLSTAIAFRAMNLSLVRGRHDGVARASRRVWPCTAEQVLRTQRQRILVLELEGSMFFGNTEALAAQLQSLPAGCRYVVVDLRRVGAVDESAVACMAQAHAMLAKAGVVLLLAGLVTDSAPGRSMAAFGCGPGVPAPWFQDADRAVEHAERGLLAAAASPEAQADSPPQPLASSELFQGLDAGQREQLAAVMRSRAVTAGEWLFREGDPGDCLSVLVQGSVSILVGPGARRLQSLSAGLMFGEVALLDGGRRSAGARADTDAQVHELHIDDLATLRDNHPLLCARIFQNIAAHLSQRLRQTTTV